jgi:hypothetical protein
MATAKLDEAAIFNVARHIAAPDARGQYLTQMCGDDRQTQARIEAMLHVHGEDRSFLESPAVELPSGVDARVSRYRVGWRGDWPIQIARADRYHLQEMHMALMGLDYGVASA